MSLGAIGCPTPDPEEGGTTPPPDTTLQFKAGTSVLFTPAGDDPAPRVADAIFDGSRALVLFTHRLGNRLAVSTDGGRSFNLVDVPRARDAGVELPATVTEDL